VPSTTEAWASALRRLTGSTAAERAERGARSRRWIEANLPSSEVVPLAALIDR
jgi:hypothetical protein